MKRYIYILTFLAYSCNTANQNDSTPTIEETEGDLTKAEVSESQIIDSLVFTTQCDTLSLSFIQEEEKRKTLLTFQEQTYLYCSPSVESKIIDSIPFNTKIRSSKHFYITLKSGHDGENEDRPASKRSEKWYETTANRKTAFLPEGRWAENILLSDVLIGVAPDLDNFLLVSFDSINDHKPLDSLKLHTKHGHDIKKLLYNGLDFCKDVIRYHTYRTNCPGTSTTTFIAVNKEGGLKEVISPYHGTESNDMIYFPMKFKSGKTLLVAGGNTDQIFDFYSGELNIMPYPSEIGIPITQLIILEKTKFAEDIEGLTSEEIEVESVVTTYYQWNGNDLIEIKTTGNKK